MKELFPIESVQKDSPRKTWLKEHNISTHYSPWIATGGDEWDPWACWSGDLQEKIERDEVATGKTEDDAITNWAKENKVALWNEKDFLPLERRAKITAS